MNADDKLAKRPLGNKMGRGLDALMKTSADRDYITCPIDSVIPTEDQPRKSFDEKKLAELAESIKENGLIQPIIVKREGTKYRIIAGERRYRASIIAGLTEIKAVIYKGEKDYQIALIENLQREDLNPIEVAEGYNELIKKHRYTQAELADKIGKSRPEISNSLRLLALSDKIKKLLIEGFVTVGQVRPLIGLETDVQDKFVIEILRKKLSARAVEKLVRDGLKEDVKKDVVKVPLFEEMEKSLSEYIPAKIKIKQSRKKSILTLEFSSEDNFSEIVEYLKKFEN